MKKTARFLVEKGFTLVELLIVIALIGVLAVAVLAAINPLEQLNRAKDTGMESDASQLLAAIDRYYASQEKFPWVDSLRVAEGFTTDNDEPYGFASAQDVPVGICSEATCAVASPGLLLGQYELKSEFMNRKFIRSAPATLAIEPNLLYIGKEEGGSKSVYACWIPTSQAKRVLAVTSITVGSPDRTAKVCTTVPGGTDWTDLGDACVICIPR